MRLITDDDDDDVTTLLITDNLFVIDSAVAVRASVCMKPLVKLVCV